MMMFRNSNLVLLAVIAASCTTFSTAVDGQSLLRRHLYDDPDATGSGGENDVITNQENASNMNGEVDDGSDVDGVAANGPGGENDVIANQENASNMNGNVDDGSDVDGVDANGPGGENDVIANQENASYVADPNADGSSGSIKATEDNAKAASGSEGQDGSDASNAADPVANGSSASINAVEDQAEASYVADPSTSSAYVSYSMATAAATAAIITGTVMYL